MEKFTSNEWWISGAELYSMYVGEGEALLRKTFQRARLAAPSIIFFDEADVVAAKRLVKFLYLKYIIEKSNIIVFFLFWAIYLLVLE